LTGHPVHALLLCVLSLTVAACTSTPPSSTPPSSPATGPGASATGAATPSPAATPTLSLLDRQHRAVLEDKTLNAAGMHGAGSDDVTSEPIIERCPSAIRADAAALTVNRFWDDSRRQVSSAAIGTRGVPGAAVVAQVRGTRACRDYRSRDDRRHFHRGRVLALPRIRGLDAEFGYCENAPIGKGQEVSFCVAYLARGPITVRLSTNVGGPDVSGDGPTEALLRRLLPAAAARLLSA
jgi:hypothetical protein